jgi:hypothetical protein
MSDETRVIPFPCGAGEPPAPEPVPAEEAVPGLAAAEALRRGDVDAFLAAAPSVDPNVIPAGPLMDALVLLELLGCVWWYSPPQLEWIGRASQSASQALAMLDQVRGLIHAEERWGYEINYPSIKCLSAFNTETLGGWAVSFWGSADEDPEWWENTGKYPATARGATLALAICRAFLALCAYERLAKKAEGRGGRGTAP